MPPRSPLALGLLSACLLLAPGAHVPSSRAEAAPNPAVVAETAGIAQARAEGHAEGTKEGEMDILKLELPLAVWSVIVFLVLLAVLGKFAWGPLMKALHQREEHLEHTLQETERARAEAERMMAEHRAQMAQAAEQVRSLIEQGRRDAEASAAEILRKAQAEAESARDRARREIGTARDQALQEIWTKTADLAVSVAGKVLDRELGADDRRRLVEVATHALPSRPEPANGRGGQPA